MVKTKEVLLKMEIKIEIPQDIIADKTRLKSVQQGILKVISKGPYEEGLVFNIVKATFDWYFQSYSVKRDWGNLRSNQAIVNLYTQLDTGILGFIIDPFLEYRTELSILISLMLSNILKVNFLNKKPKSKQKGKSIKGRLIKTTN